MIRTASCFATVLIVIVTPAIRAWAQTPSLSAPAEPSSVVPAPTIPSPIPTTLPAPEPASVAELDDLLSKLASSDDNVRKTAMADLADSEPALLPAIAVKLAALRKSADREAMNRLLAASRKKTKSSPDPEDDVPAPASSVDGGARPRDHFRSHPGSEPPDQAPQSACEHRLTDPSKADWLIHVFANGDRDKPGFRDLVTVLALERACVCMGTTAAAREIINVYTYFGDLFRIDVQTQLKRMGERALPALIEAKYHDSRMVRGWAERMLDSLGKVIPSEAVRTEDNQVLADVLRAFGRAREAEAVRVIVLYANSDRLQVREAAREAIGQIGDPARWQLREAFENLSGRKPEPSWDWRRIAVELFTAYDRARLAEVYRIAQEGLTSYKQGKVDEAIQHFDRVLARAPVFDRRAEFVPAYLDQARALRGKDLSAARAALRRAELLDPNGPHLKAVQSDRALLDAEELASRGLLDVTLLRKAVELDPNNSRAKAALDAAERSVEYRQATWRRYAAAAVIGLIALAAMMFIVLSPRRKKETTRENAAG